MVATFTVSDMLELDIFQRAALVVNPGELRRRRVDWVSALEVPVDDFIRPNELVLTTAMGIGNDERLLARFVRDVADARAAALGVAMGEYIKETPPSVIETALSCKLPLLELPWDLSFGEISEAVLRRVIDKQNVLLHGSLNVQQNLMSLISSGADLSQLAGTLAEMVRRPVAFYDPAGQIVSDDVLEWKRDPGEPLRGVVQSGRMDAAVAGSGDMLGNGFGCFAVRAGGDVEGFLVVESDPPLSEMDRVVLKHGATAASMCLLQQIAAEETATRLRRDFVWSLATGDLNSPETAVAQGSLYDYDVLRTYVGVVGQADPSGKADIGTLVERAEEMLECCNSIAKGMHRRFMGTVTGKNLVGYVEAGEHSGDIPRLVRQMARTIGENNPDMIISWGIGNSRPGFGNFRRTHVEAKQACQIGRAIKGPGKVTEIKETGVFRLLHKLASDPNLLNLWQDQLAPMMCYEREKNIPILETLDTFFRSGRNVSRAAQRLHLHRQSLKYRLEKIETLTGCDLNDPHDCFSLELSLRLHRIGQLTLGDLVED